MKMKDKKIIIVVISALLVITALAVWWYLSDRSETPENSLVVLSGGKENIIDISKLNLTSPLESLVQLKDLLYLF